VGVEILALFERLHREGNTIVLITHDRDVAAHAQRVIVLRDGRVESDVEQARRTEPVPR
jgi:ABC-type lipoprotein export system ATPase subunit